jgi:hypothetical protein
MLFTISRGNAASKSNNLAKITAIRRPGQSDKKVT